MRAALAVTVLAVLGVGAQAPGTGFHHVHLNAIDPAQAIAWYTKMFPVTAPARVAGYDGISSEKIFLLFDKVASPPSAARDSAIWHFGWGSTDMAGDFAKHQASGVSFATPLSKLAQGTVFAYMNGPDGALVEINSAASNAFVHVHLYSEHPLCAAEWYERHLGGMRRGTRPAGGCQVPHGAPSEPLAVIRSPAATVRFDDVNLIIYPVQRPGLLTPSPGHVVDHIALAVADLPGTLERLTANGVKVLRPVHPFGRGPARAAWIEGPDAIAIELVERP
jgi:catechol 2,3-dioxygenase-like lactoylglutathione lyase family enzyme